MMQSNTERHEPEHITLRIAMYRNGILPAFPCNKRMGMPLPVHADRRASNDRKGKGKAVLNGLSGSKIQGRAGMPELPFHVHR